MKCKYCDTKLEYDPHSINTMMECPKCGNHISIDENHSHWEKKK
jgi:predicted RNA-binding Zn-ribbon protein involved in translation (DUF1610 family)